MVKVVRSFLRARRDLTSGCTPTWKSSRGRAIAAESFFYLFFYPQFPFSFALIFKNLDTTAGPLCFCFCSFRTKGEETF